MSIITHPSAVQNLLFCVATPFGPKCEEKPFAVENSRLEALTGPQVAVHKYTVHGDTKNGVN